MSAETTYNAACTTSVLFELPLQIIVSIHGPDSERYLQGRITQEVSKITEGSGAQSLLLTPQGKILSQFHLFRSKEQFFCIADPGSGEEDFLRALLQFKVADQLEVESLRASHRLYTLLGPTSAEALASLGADVPTELYSHCEAPLADLPARIFRTNRGAEGFDILVATDLAEKLTNAFGELSLVDSTSNEEERQEAFQMLRITAGIPQAGADLSEKSIATDIPIEHLISFNKGCYAGQEVVEMSTARGRPNRRLLTLSCTVDQAVASGTDVTSDGKKCGTVLSSCYFPSTQECRCLAFVKTSIADDAPLAIADVNCRTL